MSVKHLVKHDFKVTAPSENMSSVWELLSTQTFLVVEEEGKYLGILTPSSFMNNPNKLVIDCLSNIPNVDEKDDIDAVISQMNKSHSSVLPVFNMGKMVGVITEDDIVASLLVSSRNLRSRLSPQSSID